MTLRDVLMGLQLWQESPRRQRVKRWGRKRQRRKPIRLPSELLLSLETAEVTVRSARDEAGYRRVTVRAEGVGWWTWDGDEDAAERLRRAWPELTEAQATRGARLLRQVVRARADAAAATQMTVRG
jgi:hypothetical protein